MTNSLNIKFEKATRLLAKHMPESDENSRKPVMFHDIRVGVYLYEQGYSDDVVLAGLLHDALEFSDINEQTIIKEFGQNILNLVKASTKDDSITDAKEKTAELIKRCVANGQDALIIKTADILDSFRYYSSQDNIEQLKYCMRNANAILKFKSDKFDDRIFEELKVWQKRYSDLTE